MSAANSIRVSAAAEGPPSRWWVWLRVLVLAALLASVAWAVAGTLHWPIVGDAPLLHYVCFLMDHGRLPYRDVFDMDMPGTYALEWAAIHLLGPGALAWRFADFALVAVIGGAMVAIAAPVDWLAGAFAGAMFALIHFRDGPTHTGQRDLMMTAMLLPACALLFWAVRRSHVTRSKGGASALPLACGVLLGMATIIKPDGVLFALALAVMLAVLLRGLQRPWAGPVLLVAAGYTLPLLVTAGWLWQHGALAAFVATCRGIVPYHASLGRPSLASLAVGSFPSVLMAITLPAIPVYVALRPWKSWEGAVLAICTGLGAVHYILQGKGFPYHRYPVEAFLLLLCALVLFPALRRGDWVRWPALLGVLLGACFLAPVSAQIACHYDWRNQEFNQMLAADLTQLGGQRLQNKVQCIDNTAGCPNTLYNLQMVQATGYLYSCYMLQPQPARFQDAYRAGFWKALQANPPQVIVVSDQDCFTMHRSFDILVRWPQLDGLLQSQYTLVAQRTPPHRVGWWRKPAVPFSYRIYVRKAGAGPV